MVLFEIAIMTGETPSARWLMIFPLIGVQFVFNVGAAMVAARLATNFDVIQIL